MIYDNRRPHTLVRDVKLFGGEVGTPEHLSQLCYIVSEGVPWVRWHRFPSIQRMRQKTGDNPCLLEYLKAAGDSRELQQCNPPFFSLFGKWGFVLVVGGVWVW